MNTPTTVLNVGGNITSTNSAIAFPTAVVLNTNSVISSGSTGGNLTFSGTVNKIIKAAAKAAGVPEVGVKWAMIAAVAGGVYVGVKYVVPFAANALGLYLNPMRGYRG